MRKTRYVVEVDKATLDYVNGLRDKHNDSYPGSGWRQKDTVRYLTECHRDAHARLAAAIEAERAEQDGRVAP